LLSCCRGYAGKCKLDYFGDISMDREKKPFPLPERLRVIRKARGISQVQLGIMAGIEKSTASARMNQYEKGKHAPDWSTLSSIAQVLNVPESYFYVVDDLEAELLLRIYFFTDDEKRRVLAFVDNDAKQT